MLGKADFRTLDRDVSTRCRISWVFSPPLSSRSHRQDMRGDIRADRQLITPEPSLLLFTHFMYHFPQLETTSSWQMHRLRLSGLKALHNKKCSGTRCHLGYIFMYFSAISQNYNHQDDKYQMNVERIIVLWFNNIYIHFIYYWGEKNTILMQYSFSLSAVSHDILGIFK